MKTRTLIGAALIAGAAALPVTAQAWWGWGPGWGDGWGDGWGGFGFGISFGGGGRGWGRGWRHPYWWGPYGYPYYGGWGHPYWGAPPLAYPPVAPAAPATAKADK
jgi:hypothetical protein